MPRTVPEWIAPHDDAPIPRAVKLRVLHAQGDHCKECTATTGLDADHITPLADGGEHRESNLQMLCTKHHRLKTAREAMERATVRRKKSKHQIKKRSSFQNGRDGKYRTRLTSNGPRTELRR